MNQKMRKSLVPDYLTNFRCIGTPCEDNCCIGWDVDFDKKSFLNYRKVKDGELGKLFNSCVKENQDSYSDEVDYATVRLRKGKVCPFLNEEHLCKIQLRFGEGYLSNVCATYPRYTNRVNNVYEHSATVSCPEAARLILTNPNGIRLIQGQEAHGSRCILTYEADTKNPSNPIRVRYLPELRRFSIDVLQDRGKTLQERILFLGEFCHGVKQVEMKKGKETIPELIAIFRERGLSGRETMLQTKPAGGITQMDILAPVIASLNVFSEIDSQRYINYTREFLNGIRGGDEESNEPESIRKTGYHLYYAPFIKDREFLLENYLVNFVFKDLFPAAEGQDVFDAYMMLVIRYSLIKLHLTGIGIARKELTEDTAVGFIQAFSKTVEHHKTYLESIADHMTKNRYNTLEHMNILLQD